MKMSSKGCTRKPIEDGFFNDLDAASTVSEYMYENFKISKTEDSFLGMGSYGAVYKATCDELPCAAKILHLVHLPLKVGDANTQKVITKFDMECRLLSHIRHPNIVQYLGTCRDPDTNLPVLLMELMDEGLTTFLEKSVNPLEYHIQLNLCHDVALALAYLHRHGIIHRDLSSNNVLLIAGSRAKVTDFGMCKLMDVSATRSSRFSQTYCPGTEVYMAPEALRCPPEYTEKIDCFAFGVLVIQVLTRLFPDPGPKAVKISDPLSPTGSSERPVLEVERRRSHIDQISPTHPLVTVAIECLNYQSEDRPTSGHICTHLADLKRSPQYLERCEVDVGLARSESTSPEPVNPSEMSREIKILRQKVESLQHQLHVKEQQLLVKDGELAHLAKSMMGRNDITAPDLHVRDEPKPCEESDSNLHATLLQREKEIENLRSSLCRRDLKINEIQHQLESMAVRESKRPRSASRSSSSKRLSIESHRLQMEWKSGINAPRKMALGSVAVDGPIVYFRPSLSGSVYAYDSDSQEWGELPPCSCYDFAIVMAGGLLTAVGGNQSGGAISTLLSLTQGEDGSQKWTRHYPPMMSGRYNSAIVSTDRMVIVAGGYTRPIVVSTVEILDTEDKQWYLATSLPTPLSEASATIYNDHLFVVGGWTLDKRPNKSVFSCLLSDLVSSAKKNINDSFMWEVVTELPVYNASCTTVCGRLIMFGGLDSNNQATNTVRVYNSTTRCFESCSRSLIPRYCCLPAPLPHSRVMIVGGYTDKGTTSSAEIATISFV